MFDALIEEINASDDTRHMAVWRPTIQELFALEFLCLPIRVKAMSAERRRFPTLKGMEADSLLDLFRQVFVATPGTYADWKRLATRIVKAIVVTKWGKGNYSKASE